MKKLVSILLLISMLTLCITACGNTKDTTDPVLQPKYDNAMELLEAGNYTEAYKIFAELGDYKDAKKHLGRFLIVPVKTTVTEAGTTEERIIAEFTLNDKKLPAQLNHYENDSTQIDFVYNDKNILTEMKQQGQSVELGGLTFMTDGESYQFSYDKNGNPIREILDKQNSGKTTTNYTYDADGKMIKIENIEQFPGDPNLLKDQSEFVYDAHGNLIKEIFTNEEENDTDIIEFIHTYDANGKLIKKDYKLGSWQYIHDYTYDENGLLVKEIEQEIGWMRDPQESIYSYSYDANGNLIKRVDEEQATYSYTYDELGILKQASYTTPDGTIKSTDYTLIYLEADIPMGVAIEMANYFYAYVDITLSKNLLVPTVFNEALSLYYL